MGRTNEWLCGFLIVFHTQRGYTAERALNSYPTPRIVWIRGGEEGVWSLRRRYKAMHVGDLITIVVAQGTTANNANTVSTARMFNASSGISALAGHLKTSGVQQIFSPQSSQNLSGKSQGSTTSSLNTTLAGRVVAVLPSRAMVIEAERQLTMNNEKQTILLRGLVRQGDIAPDGSVASNYIANLELELKGKGVLSDGTRPPNPLVRTLLKIVGF
ncbi:MAG TPA: flagellar basal body L-ring protein FlgH [Terriglobales bacterium]|nr:flagellar basal body L-ring protein FlgH [Terriglobales bacterium]